MALGVSYDDNGSDRRSPLPIADAASLARTLGFSDDNRDLGRSESRRKSLSSVIENANFPSPKLCASSRNLSKRILFFFKFAHLSGTLAKPSAISENVHTDDLFSQVYS